MSTKKYLFSDKISLDYYTPIGIMQLKRFLEGIMSKKIVIIGGVAGGATAATRLRRLNEADEIVLFEKGEHISFANCGLPYYIGGTIKERDQLLLQTVTGMNEQYHLDIRNFSEVTAIHPEEHG